MALHPELGYFDEGCELTDAALYENARRPFGEASMLPPVAYRSKIYGELEDEKIWTRSWVALGADLEIPNAGDLLPFTIGNHGVHVQREVGGGLTGRFNKAQHGGCRTVPLQCQTGVKTKCSFTSCGFSRDRDAISGGELDENASVTHQYLGLTPERLLPVRLEKVGPLIFANLDPDSPSLFENQGQLPNILNSHLNGSNAVSAKSWFDCDANWKTLGRSFGAFAAASEPSDFGSLISADSTASYTFNEGEDYTTTPWDASGGAAVTDAVSELPVFSGLPANYQQKGYLSWVFPNLILATFPTHVAAFILQPIGMAVTRVRYSIFVENFDRARQSKAFDALDQAWQSSFDQISAHASSNQRIFDTWGTAANPGTNCDAPPIENVRSGYEFQRYLTRKVLTEHAYYWASPLYGRGQ